jgi:hypothetical protein
MIWTERYSPRVGDEAATFDALRGVGEEAIRQIVGDCDDVLLKRVFLRLSDQHAEAIQENQLFGKINPPATDIYYDSRWPIPNKTDRTNG